jgi:hypothetical protein
MDSTLPLPELIAPCSSSDSLSERDDFSFFFPEEDFEISNSCIFEKPLSVTLVLHCSHNLASSNNFKMESECVDP